MHSNKNFILPQVQSNMPQAILRRTSLGHVSFAWGGEEDQDVNAAVASPQSPPLKASSSAHGPRFPNSGITLPQASANHQRSSFLSTTLLQASTLTRCSSHPLAAAQRPRSDPILSVARSSVSEDFPIQGSISPPGGTYALSQSASHGSTSSLTTASVQRRAFVGRAFEGEGTADIRPTLRPSLAKQLSERTSKASNAPTLSAAVSPPSWASVKLQAYPSCIHVKLFFIPTTWYI